ncbi:MAG: hypothetical protein LAQ30_24020 [Acidobacteriia bacterium]|nr:hypothetical protein [Terriglobia bacterium]
MKMLAAGAAIGSLLAFAAWAQAPDQYLDYYIVKVKPEKRADFDAIAKKIADANRKNQGDKWIAMEMIYGENDTVGFVSSRKDMAAIDMGMESFMKAMKESYGDKAEGVFHDLEACTSSSWGEIRRRRPDLSSIPHPDQYMELVGRTRFLRTAAIHVRPGHADDFEEVLRMSKIAREKADPERVVSITQSVVGSPRGMTYYITSLQPSMAGFDAKLPPLKEALGEESYMKYEKLVADSVIGSETAIMRMLPALSNPPEEVVRVSEDFWMPKMMMTPTTAARSKKNKKTAENPQQ